MNTIWPGRERTENKFRLMRVESHGMVSLSACLVFDGRIKKLNNSLKNERKVVVHCALEGRIQPHRTEPQEGPAEVTAQEICQRGDCGLCYTRR